MYNVLFPALFAQLKPDVVIAAHWISVIQSDRLTLNIEHPIIQFFGNHFVFLDSKEAEEEEKKSNSNKQEIE